MKLLNTAPFLVVSAILISGCTDNGFLFRSFGTYDAPADKGVYKIEPAYEIDGVVYTPAENYTYTEEGFAGWYAADSNQMITANGERYSEHEMTAMHKTLPLPTFVRVTNLANGKTEIVRVNDRGPMDNTRIMDVSEKAARALQFSETGPTRVRVEIMAPESKMLKSELVTENAPLGEEQIETEAILSPGVHSNLTVPAQNTAATPLNSGHYFVQIGAFSLEESVTNIKTKLSNYNNLIVKDKEVNDKILHLVQIGPFASEAEATKALDKIHQEGYSDSKIIREN